MEVRHDRKQSLFQGESHHLPEQAHFGMRGHQIHVDVTEHTDADTILAVDNMVSTDDGVTWSYGGGWTLRGGSHTADKEGNPVTYSVTTFGHQPVHRQLDHNGNWIGEDPAPKRLVRTLVHVLHRPVSMEGVALPGGPKVELFGLSWKPGFMADNHLGNKSVVTRIHMVGTPEARTDKSLIPKT